jgi:pyruvate/2-oxoglutarate dehydrogenase complex dihydrolipoamide dehydrogenase (E3) component
VDWDNKIGVRINDHFQTTNPDIYACGDCCSQSRFTHSADFQARLAIRNMFLGESQAAAKSNLLIPWCVYTDPEVAHVGVYAHDASPEEASKYETFTRYLRDVDRCICDYGPSRSHHNSSSYNTHLARGFVKITMLTATTQIVGATIVGANAGDMISELTLAIQYGLTVPQLAGTIHPYPTTQEATRQACLQYYGKYYKNPDGVCMHTLRLHMRNVEAAEQHQHHPQAEAAEDGKE